MTGPRVEVPSGKLNRILSPDEFDQVQTLPGHAIKRDPFGKQTDGPPLSRILTADEFEHAQTLSGPAVKELKIPLLPPMPAAPRDVTRTPRVAPGIDPNEQGKPLAPFNVKDPTTYANPILRQVINPALENPFTTAAVGVAPFAAAGASPIAGLAVGGAMAASMVYHIAQYGWQKAAELTLSPEDRARAEADPERISGESAAVQALMLGLGPLIHVGFKGPSIGEGMVEAGAKGLPGMQSRFFESDAGATTLGATAARHGLAADASPYPPDSPLAAKWQEAHTAATESFKDVTPDAVEPTVADALKPRMPAPVSEPVAAESAPAQTAAEGTGPTKVRGLSRGIEEKAIEARLTQGFDDLPKYQQVSMADQAAKAADLLASDAVLARRVALGEAPAPEGVLPESVLVAVENKAIADGDVATLRDLAHGKLAEQATEMGQRIRTLAERDPESPVGAIKSVIEARKSTTQSVPKATEEVVATIRKQISASARKPKDWNAFVDSLRC